MERIKDLRSVTLPDGNLARRDVQSQLISVPTGKFTRNCVLTGKADPDMTFPLYVRTPGLISTVSGISPEGFGYLDASEGTATNVFPKHRALAVDTDYWAASTLGCWVAYHHELRPTMIRGYKFITENEYTPRVWRVEGSNDNVTWTTLHTITVDWTWGTGKQVVEYEIPLENRDYFMHHRLIVDEFDATSIRIYYLQFWDGACPSAADLYLDADIENPLQLSFADGYNVDGSPKDILFTINIGTDIEVTSLLDSQDKLLENNMIPCVLFAKYDPNTSLVSFVAENQYFEDAMIKPENMGIQTVSIKEDSSFPMSRIFDGNTSTYAWFFYSQGYFWDFRISPYITTATIYIKNGDYNVKIKFSEDDGQTWASTVVPSSFDGIWALDRVYNINRIYLTNYVNYARIYELRFYEAGAIKKHKLTNGEIYEYDPVAAQWNKTYKLPIGYFSLWRNPEGTSWEVGPFIPTHIPQMAIAPFFRKTSGGLAL
jgi:hypothetical protein